METIKVKIKRLDDRAVLPSYAHEGDVCMDFTAIDVEYDEEKDLYIYHTGWAFESDLGYGQFLFPRSSNRKTNAYLVNSVGVADSALYRGEILFCYKNRDSIETVAKISAISDCLNWGVTGPTSIDIISQRVSLYKKNALDFMPYQVGDRIGQFVFMSFPKVNLELSEELSETERGEGGFGSTGN